jgi:hypothetical protein
MKLERRARGVAAVLGHLFDHWERLIYVRTHRGGVMGIFRVLFTGVCAFTKDQTLCVLVDATEPAVTKSTGPDHAKALPPHYAFIRFPTSDASTDDASHHLHTWKSPKTDDIFNGSSIKTGITYLYHDEIVLPQANTINGQPPKLAKMAEFTASDVAKARESIVKDPTSSAISAFARLPKNAVKSFAPSNFKFTVYNPKTDKKLYKGKTFEQMVMLSLKVGAGPLITIKPFSADSEHKERHIKYNIDASDSWMIIGHSSLADIIQAPGVDPGFGEPDYHFEFLYKFSNRAPKSEEMFLPFYEIEEQDTLEPEIGYPRCIPAQFE